MLRIRLKSCGFSGNWGIRKNESAGASPLFQGRTCRVRGEKPHVRAAGFFRRRWRRFGCALRRWGDGLACGIAVGLACGIAPRCCEGLLMAFLWHCGGPGFQLLYEGKFYQ